MAKKIPPFVIRRKRLYAKVFSEAGYDDVARHLSECSEVELLLGCQHCGDLRYVVYRCDARVCPICSYWQSVERSKFIEKLLGKMEYPKMLTLTIPARNEPGRDTIKYLRKCFQKLRDRKVFSKVKGGAYQIEVKIKEGHFHIHMHIILDCPFIHYTKIYSAWSDITGVAGVQVDIRAAKTPQQCAYIVKYSQKSAELKADGSDIVQWYLAVRGSRLFGTFGEWFNVKIEDLLEPDEFVFKASPCPCCGEIGYALIIREGALIYGKEWVEMKKFFDVAGFPLQRPIADVLPPESIQEELDLALGD